MEITTDPAPAVLDDHPAAALFPLLPVDEPEFGQLVDDVRVEAKERFEEEAREAQRQAGVHGREGGRGHRKTLRADSPEGFPRRDERERTQ